MPLINGIKMACEPCIRGHRSTKCTHANERLMVPVKKPGRPLSACPHLHDQLCGCSSVTAAIPRKSTCGCGSTAHAATAPDVRPLPSAIPDVPSPTKVAFKVQKNSSRPSSRKYNFHPDNLPRMDPASINVAPILSPKKPQILAPALPNGQTAAIPHTSYQNGMSNGVTIGAPLPHNGGVGNKYPSLTNGSSFMNDTSVVSNGPYTSLGTMPFSNEAMFDPATNTSISTVMNSEQNESRKSSGSGECCSDRSAPPLSHQPSTSSEDSIPNTTLQQYPFPPNFSTDRTSFSHLYPQTTVYSYPPSYGSYDKPLQPDQWRQGTMSNMYNHSPLPLDSLENITDLSTFSTPPINPYNVDTLHSCGCGESCQCIGCAAHPYNDATQEYIKSALKLQESSTSTPTTSDFDPTTTLKFSPGGTPLTTLAGPHLGGFPNGANGLGAGDTSSGKSADTPSDGTSDEQNYAAGDFFFVNYPFGGDGCGGETASCPCGDDCECLGCTIHRNYSVPVLPEETVNGTASNGNGIAATNARTVTNGTGMPQVLKVEDGLEDDENIISFNGLNGHAAASHGMMSAPLVPMPVKRSCCSSS